MNATQDYQFNKKAAQHFLTMAREGSTFHERSEAVRKLWDVIAPDARDNPNYESSTRPALEAAYAVSNKNPYTRTWYVNESTEEVLEDLGYTKRGKTLLLNDKILFSGMDTHHLNVWLCANGLCCPVQESKPE